MLPSNARQAHLEMGDTPIVDKGAFVMLGSDDFLLRQLAEKRDFAAIKDYIAWTMHAAQAIAVKVVNPGGISAFKFNQRKLDLDEKHVYYGVTPRDIILTLARGLHELGVAHPLHVHGCNLGVPGDVETTLATIKRPEGLPIHLTHIQFHSYGTEGERQVFLGRRARSPKPSTQYPTSRSTSARSCSGRRARHPATRCASSQRAARRPEEVGRHGHRVRRGLRRRAVHVSRQELRATRCSGRSGSSCSCSSTIPGASS